MDLKRFKVLIILAVGFVSASSASAEDKLTASVALKGLFVTSWSNTWNDGVSEHKYDLKDPVLMVGPSLKISYGVFFTGLTYLTSLNDFNIEETGIKIGEGDRQDVDFVIGYSPLSWVSIFCGYKRIDAGTNKEYGSSVAIGMEGPAAGISVNYLIPSTPVYVYATVAYMYLDGQAWREEVWTNAYSYEGGLRYSPIDQWSLSIGYKGQDLDYSNDAAGTDELKGITFSFDFRF